MKDLTRDSIRRHILTLAGFIALTAVAQTVYFLTDLYFVGRLGKEAVAGVGIAGNLAIAVLALTQSLSVGTLSLVAQALGGKDQARAEVIFHQALLLSLLVGGLFGLAVFGLRDEYCRWLAADPTTAALGLQYLAWFIPGLVLLFPASAMIAAHRATGDLRVPTVIQLGVVALNTALVPVLISGWGPAPRLGVAGAAMATSIAIAFSCVCYLAAFQRKGSRLRLRAAAWRPRPDIWRGILRIGAPTGGEMALSSVFLVLIYDLTRPFGVAAQAAFGIGARIMQALSLPATAIGFAAVPVAAQNYGARLGGRVRETFYSAAGMGAGVMLALTLFCQIAPATLVGFFNRDPRVLVLGAEYLRIGSWNFVCMGIVLASASLFQAMGNTLPALAGSALRLVLFALPAYVLSSRAGFQLWELWTLSVASYAIQTGLSVGLLHREFRKKLGPATAAGAAGPALRTGTEG